MSDYDNAPTNPHHGGKMTPHQMSQRIEELEAALAEVEDSLTFAKGVEIVIRAERDRLSEQVKDMIDASGQECACGYDRPGDVCLGHWPKFKALAVNRDRLAQLVRRAQDLIDPCYPDTCKAWQDDARAAINPKGETP